MATLPIYGYASYWAFGVGRLLPSKLYKRQALSAGFLALALWLAGWSLTVLSNSPNPQLGVGVTVIVFSVPLFAFFYFTDEAMKAARRSDPLFRDILHWNQARILLWTVVVIALGSVVVVCGYATVTDNVAILNGIGNGNYGGVLFSLDANYLYNLAFIGVIWLAAAALRAKWDRYLRRNFLWLAVAVSLFFTLANVSFPGSFVVLFDSVGFALFMAARSLTPVNKLALSPTPVGPVRAGQPAPPS